MLQRASLRYTIALYIMDIAATLGSLYAALLARRAWPFGRLFVEQYGGLSLPIFGIVAILWSASFLAAGAYDPRRILRVEHEIGRVVAAIAVAALLFAGALYFSYRDVSRLIVLYFILFDVAAVLWFRMLARLIWHNLGSRRLPASRVLIVGAGALGQEIVQSFLKHSWMGLETIGFLDDAPEKQGVQFEGLSVLGTLVDAPKIVAEHNITDVVFALPMRAHREMANLVAQLEGLPVNIKTAPDLGPLVFYKMTVETIGNIPLIGLKEPVIQPHQRILKRAIDIIVSFLGLVVTLPISVATAVAIKMDSPGPAIFRQQRVGEGGKLFTMHKFRSMHEGAEKAERGLVERAINGPNQAFKIPNDERVTRVGRFLRRTSLDELPQLWNILKGDMSLVGPRPELPSLVEHYEPWQRKRFGVPQGLTGWWQIHDRSDKPMYWHTEDDLYYLQNYSLLLDLRIFALTFLAVIRGKGAY
jgi:exopolysaccharide biosynthesis polyprenyl glycosylphosphotransferase